jgi:UvrD-like helicase C-terminal domain
VAVVAAVELDVPFRAPDLPLPIEDPRLDGLLDRLDGAGDQDKVGGWRAGAPPLLPALGRLRADVRREDEEAGIEPSEEPSRADLVTALLGWAAPLANVESLRSAVVSRRAALARLRRDDAALSLATAHGTKGLEWDHVLVLTDGFPGRRSVTDAAEPDRALEEERRLAYVAWTRARRSLTLLYDPEAPSRFLEEAFDPDELGVQPAVSAA